MLITILVGLVCLALGAYGHKWLAKKTELPSNVTISNVSGIAGTLAKDVQQAAKKL